MVPAQLVADAVPVLPYAGAEAFDLRDKGIPIEFGKVFVHVGCPQALRPPVVSSRWASAEAFRYHHQKQMQTSAETGAIFLTLVLGLSCRTVNDIESRTPIVQPGAPGAPSRTISAESAVALGGVQFTREDVRFMQGMITHHAQAVEMAALILARPARDDMRLLGRRIDQSQTDEIKLMQQWLERRGQPMPDPHAQLHGGPLMPGMLTDEEMRRLAAAKGREFDRLFLEGMIKHHEGALVMVKDLAGTDGAGQDPDIFAFASEIEADQTAEIARMRTLLSELEK